MKRRCVCMAGLFFDYPSNFLRTAGMGAESKIIKFGTGLPLRARPIRGELISDRFIRKATDDVNNAGGIDIGGVNYKWQVINIRSWLRSGPGTGCRKTIGRWRQGRHRFIMGGVSRPLCLDFLSSHKILHFATGTAHHYGSGQSGRSISLTGLRRKASVGVSKYLGRQGIKTAVFINPDEDHGRAHSKARVAQMEAVGVKISW